MYVQSEMCWMGGPAVRVNKLVNVPCSCCNRLILNQKHDARMTSLLLFGVLGLDSQECTLVAARSQCPAGCSDVTLATEMPMSSWRHNEQRLPEPTISNNVFIWINVIFVCLWSVYVFVVVLVRMNFLDPDDQPRGIAALCCADGPNGVIET